MNLHVEYDGEIAELWQTPTDVSYDCMKVDGKIHYSLSGDKARMALDKYAEWVKSRPRCADDAVVMWQLEHVELLKKAKNLEVYIL